MSQPKINASRYWVFTEEQLAEAVDAWIRNSKLPPTDEEIHGLWNFLESDECAELGMRRGGED